MTDKMKARISENQPLAPVVLYGVDSEGNPTQVTLADGKLDVNATVSVTMAPDTIGSAPVVGQHTVTSVASEVFADGSAKANRTRMEIANMGDIDIYIGGSDVAPETGIPIYPGQQRELKFSSDTAVAIYAISPGKSVLCRVMEV